MSLVGFSGMEGLGSACGCSGRKSGMAGFGAGPDGLGVAPDGIGALSTTAEQRTQRAIVVGGLVAAGIASYFIGGAAARSMKGKGAVSIGAVAGALGGVMTALTLGAEKMLLQPPGGAK